MMLRRGREVAVQERLSRINIQKNQELEVTIVGIAEK